MSVIGVALLGQYGPCTTRPHSTLTHWHLENRDAILKLRFSFFLMIGALRSMPRDLSHDKSTFDWSVPSDNMHSLEPMLTKFYDAILRQ